MIRFYVQCKNHIKSRLCVNTKDSMLLRLAKMGEKSAGILASSKMAIRWEGEI